MTGGKAILRPVGFSRRTGCGDNMGAKAMEWEQEPGAWPC
jgi:hypothetical protein